MSLLPILNSTEATQDPLCSPGQYTYRKVLGPVVALQFGNFIHDFSNEVASDPQQSSCINTNQQGTFAGRYYSPSDNLNKTMRIAQTRNGVSYDAATTGDAVIEKAYSSSRNAYTYPINYNFQDGKIVYKKNSFLNYDIDWAPKSIASTMKYADGNDVLFKSHRFSPNGKYFVAQIDGPSFVRVNTRTQEMTPFYRATRLTDRKAMTISNDGRYVFTDVDNKILIHDLANCVDIYTKGEWQKAVTTAIPDGCERTVDLEGQIQVATGGSQGGYYTSLTQYPQFAINGSSITFSAGKSTTDWRKVTIRANNYAPSVEGYLALGDSFSSGEGDKEGGDWYESGTDEQGNKDTFAGRNLCHLSRRSYPYLMAVELGYLSTNSASPPTDGLFHSVACSGAWTHNIIGGEDNLVLGPGDEDTFKESDNQYKNDYFGQLSQWQPGRVKQLDIFDTNVSAGYSTEDNLPEIITLGIGGNDAKFGELLHGCILDFGQTCKQAVRGSVDAGNVAYHIAKLKQPILESYRSTKDANPDARIYVHGYPKFVQGYGGSCDINTLLNSQETALVEEGVEYMNAIVKSAAAEAGVVYVDITEILEGVNQCSDTPRSEKAVNGVMGGNDIGGFNQEWIGFLIDELRGTCILSTGCLGKETFHPNQRAHVKYKDEILAQTNQLTTLNPDSIKTALPIPDAFFGLLAQERIREMNSNNGFLLVSDTPIPTPGNFISYGEQANSVDILYKKSLPNALLKVYGQSTPTLIGEYEADINGVLDITIDIPEFMRQEPGLHEFHIEGINKYGEKIDLYEQVVVGYSNEDFDGDGVFNSDDSCVSVRNSDQDVDEDGIDDACDGDVIVPVVEPPKPEHPVCRLLRRLEKRLPWYFRPLIYRLYDRFDCVIQIN